MSNEFVIDADSVSKKYCRSIRHTMVYGFADICRNLIARQSNTENLREGEFWAVQDLNFTVKRGECLGLIGPNGSGKSTLLKMLNGILMPDKGKIMISGRVGALIEVGAGFHPLLTGRENIFVNGAILGMSRSELNRKLDAIIDFADIGDFIDSPVKHYSSGMFVRLGFAIVSQLKPEILLIDEVLAVGDINFQIKCFNHVNQLINNGSSVIIVSHNLYHIQRMCERCILLQSGSMLEYGPASDVVGIYEQKYAWLDVKGTNKLMQSNCLDFISATILTSSTETSEDPVVETGVPFSIKLIYRIDEKLPRGLQVGFLVKTSDGQRVSGGTTKYLGTSLRNDCGMYKLTFTVEYNRLLQGNYVVSFSAFDEEYAQQYGAWESTLRFRVVTDGYNGLHAIGVTYLPSHIELETISVR